ncbi:hypothetical protein QWJ34_11850 [Saccharibacillus sp. CPCC 101409]|uniref:hypothetical protein n=1 Tax=Saccharibacillus sp. CPCC 101409 TaxID=3058041 RepID=UPI002672443C|nr:hypothetical protein [Saccharibacillus sp. CPCC 101409]MDO3410455.1 hypothetical protein [Saccharibacillus sp. CPCC 101409]
MRKGIKTAAAAALLLTLVSGAALADPAGVWTRAGKTPGRTAVVDGTEVVLPGRADKKKAAASIDPAAGKAALRAQTSAAEGKTGTFTARLTADGLNDTLTFRYAQKGGETTLLPAPDLGYDLHPLPGGDALVEYAASIYRLDGERRTLSLFLKGQTGAYSKSVRKWPSGKSTPPMVVWGQRASVSPDGTKVLFWTNRAVTATGSEDGENWIKDLNTGAEKKVYGAGYQVLGWDAKNRFYLDLGDGGIAQVDSGGGGAAKVVSSYSVSAAAGNYLLSQISDGSLGVRNLSTGAARTFRGGGLNRVRSIAASADGGLFAVVNAPDRTKAASTLLLIDPATLEYERIDEPAGGSVIGVSWADGGTLLVQVRNRSTAAESTYAIDTEKEAAK